MHIGVDGTALYGRYHGVEYALWNLLGALAALDNENSYTVYVPRDGPPPEQLVHFGARWRFARLPFAGREKARRIAWQQGVLPHRLRRDGCDLLHAPTYVLPLLCGLPMVLNVHDLIALQYPAYATPANRLHYGAVMRPCLARAAVTVVPSAAVAQAVARFAPGAAARTRVVAHAAADCFFDVIAPEQVTAVRARYRLPEKFLLYVGNFEPKKNLSGLLQALELLPEAPPLVLAGGARPWSAGALQAAAGASRRQVIGYIERADLPALYAACHLFVFPSLAEGFGLPVIEAMACGAPVVTSTRMPLPEVGSAALLCEPEDAGSIAAAIRRALDDDALRASLGKRGRRYAAPYTWRAAATSMLEIYRSLL